MLEIILHILFIYWVEFNFYLFQIFMIEKQKGEEKKRGGGTLIKLVEATFIPSAVNYCCLFF